MKNPNDVAAGKRLEDLGNALHSGLSHTLVANYQGRFHPRT